MSQGTVQLQIRSSNPACQLASFFKTILRPISPSLKNNAHQDYCSLGTGSLWLMLTAPRVCFWGRMSAVYFTETMAHICLEKWKAAIQHRLSCSIHKSQGKINKHTPTLELPGKQIVIKPSSPGTFSVSGCSGGEHFSSVNSVSLVS